MTREQDEVVEVMREVARRDFATELDDLRAVIERGGQGAIKRAHHIFDSEGRRTDLEIDFDGDQTVDVAFRTTFDSRGRIATVVFDVFGSASTTQYIYAGCPSPRLAAARRQTLRIELMEKRVLKRRAR